MLARLRSYKAEVIRAIRLSTLDEDRLHAWQERVAICLEDGGLDQDAAEAVAWRQVDAAQDTHVGPRAARAASLDALAKRVVLLPHGRTWRVRAAGQ